MTFRSDEVGADGTVPLQGSDYLNMDKQWYDRSPYVNQSFRVPVTEQVKSEVVARESRFSPEWIQGASYE